ncbi:MAG: glycoside hydrolase family 99-like domain-containing protein [Gammaproteobacteria bacterium]|nr:glycoside hydrolase family 99-like domain-containing protein [Gammaproteobacteria bacterium]
MTPDIRLIAFYLPQFHPIPENDEWWGKGFTEWRNVAKARPLFPGHYQPHLPADLGFYDLRLPEAREAQAALAHEYGIHGFCYYHYWFNGRRVLERPFNEVLASGKPDFPFCLCWANENWTRIWDGGEKNVLLEQKYSHEDDLAHIESLIPAFRDERYIRINGKPLFLVYRSGLLPNPARTAEIWREAAKRAGIGGLYLIRVESFGNEADPHAIGFDASVEFAPFGGVMGKLKFSGTFHRLLAKLGVLSKGFIENSVIDYDTIVEGMLKRPEPDYKRFHGVTPAWDNSARRKQNAFILDGATPLKYQAWLRTVVERTLRKPAGDERIVFINAWNEWAEGNHLEPDLEWGRAYLEATRNAVLGATQQSGAAAPANRAPELQATPARRTYWKARAFLKEQANLLRLLGFRKK